MVYVNELSEIAQRVVVARVKKNLKNEGMPDADALYYAEDALNCKLSDLDEHFTHEERKQLKIYY